MNESQQRLIEILDRPMVKNKPLLAKSVFKNAQPHEIMMIGGNEIAGSPISFVAVKGITTWAVFYAYGQRSESHVSANGMKATLTQVKKWMDIEPTLEELYRA